MSPMWTDVLTAITAAGALVAAWFAWLTSVNALRTSYRPVIRVVGVAKTEWMGAVQVMPDNPFLDQSTLLLKNIGLGPALSVMLFEEPIRDGDTPLAQVQLVERLGDSPTGTEMTRPGRTKMETLNFMEVTRKYRVVYQDIGGGWHETHFVFRQHDLVVELRGPLRWWHRLGKRSIPKFVRELGSVVPAHPAL